MLGNILWGLWGYYYICMQINYKNINLPPSKLYLYIENLTNIIIINLLEKKKTQRCETKKNRRLKKTERRFLIYMGCFVLFCVFFSVKKK